MSKIKEVAVFEDGVGDWVSNPSSKNFLLEMLGLELARTIPVNSRLTILTDGKHQYARFKNFAGKQQTKRLQRGLYGYLKRKRSEVYIYTLTDLLGVYVIPKQEINIISTMFPLGICVEPDEGIRHLKGTHTNTFHTVTLPVTYLK